MASEKPVVGRQRLTIVAFVLGAIVGGVLAGAIGGLLGAGLALGAVAVARARWPAPLRNLLTACILVGGFGALWIGAGFVRAVLGLVEASRMTP